MKNETEVISKKLEIITYIIIFTLLPIPFFLILLEIFVFQHSLYTLIGKISLTTLMSGFIYFAIFVLILFPPGHKEILVYWKAKGKIGYYVMIGDVYLIILMILVIIFVWMEIDLRILLATLVISFAFILGSTIIYTINEAEKNFLLMKKIKK